MEERNLALVSIGLLMVFGLSILVSLPEEPSIVGAATHSTYPLFSESEGVSLFDGGVAVQDDAVYNMGWYSIDGDSWQSFTLQGDAYGDSQTWLAGDSYSYNLPVFSYGEHYIIVYSCSWDDGWDCHGNNAYPDGFWQLSVINNSASDVPGTWCGFHAIHTEFSDGTMSIQESADSLQDYFNCGSTNDHDTIMNQSEWDASIAISEAENVDDEFAYFFGVEWSGSQHIHYITMNPSPTVKTVGQGDFNTVAELASWLAENEGIGQHNHPARTSGWTDFSNPNNYNETWIPLVEFQNYNHWHWNYQWDCAEGSGCTTYENPHRYADYNDDSTGWIKYALDNGIHLGFSCGNDYHGDVPFTPQCYTGIELYNITRQNVYDQLKARHTWVAQDKIRMSLAVFNGSQNFYMGDIFTTNKSWIGIRFYTVASPGENITAINLFYNGVIVNVFEYNDEDVYEILTQDLTPNHEDYIFFEVIQSDGKRAWSSPFWVTSLVDEAVVESDAIIADHTVVDQFDDIPSCWMDEVKKMQLVVAGESHSGAYGDGLVLLNDLYPAYEVNSGSFPKDYNDQYLRYTKATWGDVDNAEGWIWNHGEEDWFTSDLAIERTKAGIAYADSINATIDALGFGWCWDMLGASSATVDPTYGVHWFGKSIGGPEGDREWGLDAGDIAMTGNSVTMDSYLQATQEYNEYCVANGIDTKVFFTTGPVDEYGNDESRYQAHIKHEYIRDFVRANDTRVLFDYADILSYNDAGDPGTLSWNTHEFPVIHQDNMGGNSSGHIGTVGSLRLGKAMWWMMARMAGWNGTPEDNMCGQPAPTCVDSDGGSDHLVRGSITMSDGSVLETGLESEEAEVDTEGTGVEVISADTVIYTVDNIPHTLSIGDRMDFGVIDLQITNIDYYGPGDLNNVVYSDAYKYEDYCEYTNMSLVEVTCGEGWFGSNFDLIICTYGCGDGVCLSDHPETCYNDQYNQNEVFVDCGGACPACECYEDSWEDCSGEIANGYGNRTLTCDVGNYTDGACVVTGCENGYHQEGNACVANSVPSDDAIYADHTVVDQFDDIPACYLDEVKKLWLVVAGESHSAAYRSGLASLASSYPEYAVSVTESGTPEPYTDQNLRVSRATWGDVNTASGWLYGYGEEDWCCGNYPSYPLSQSAIDRTKAGITYANENGFEIGAMGFGWCYDDGYYIYDSYLNATQQYIDFVEANNYPTNIFFTTGPIDGYIGIGQNGYDNYRRYEEIRNYVAADPSRAFLDYADILSYNDLDVLATETYDGHTFPVIHPDNELGGYTGHIGGNGALRIAKATWWMLARMQGWDGTAGDTCGPEVIIADHTVIDDFDSIPQCWIEEAKEQIVMGYGHTSHGSQITSGLSVLNTYTNSLGGDQNLYAWNNGGSGGALDLEEGSGYNPGWLRYDVGYGGWDTRTRNYFEGYDPEAGSADHSDVNAIMWSWCGQVGGFVNTMDSYLINPALSIENDFGVEFVFMTGHLDGGGSGGSAHLANEVIRDHVRNNGGVLFDFADIERYDPEGFDYLDLSAGAVDGDGCAYVNGTAMNWCTNWCADNPGHELCTYTSCAHSQSLNCNLKSRAFWWMVARMAGWDGTAGDACP